MLTVCGYKRDWTQTCTTSTQPLAWKLVTSKPAVKKLVFTHLTASNIPAAADRTCEKLNAMSVHYVHALLWQHKQKVNIWQSDLTKFAQSPEKTKDIILSYMTALSVEISEWAGLSWLSKFGKIWNLISLLTLSLVHPSYRMHIHHSMSAAYNQQLATSATFLRRFWSIQQHDYIRYWGLWD